MCNTLTIITYPLEAPRHLVNQRLGLGWLAKWKGASK